MVSVFLEKNRPLLQVYAKASRIIGWALLIMGALGGLLFVLDLIRGGNQMAFPAIDTAFSLFKRSWFEFLVPGLIAVGAAQLILYLFSEEVEPGLLLCHGDKVLYVYAALVAWWGVAGILYHWYVNPGYLHPRHIWLVYYVLPVSALTAGKVLILVGFAQFLRRILPMIRESKTLV